MVLPLPMRMGSLESFVSSTRARIRHGDAKLVMIDDQLAPFYEAVPGDPPIVSMAAVLPGAPGVPSGDRLEVPAPDPERLVILQYTSGSTSEPKGVMIPDRVLTANVDACCEAAKMTDHEVMVSWLPLYHDMGLVGFISIPMTRGVDLVQAAPQDFLGHPGNWMQWVSDWGGTVTAGPNFAWVLATRALRRMRDLDLSTLTLALSGAEPVDPDAMEAFVAAAEPFGFPAGGVFPAFGMAEVAIGGSFPPRNRGLVCDTVDRVMLERDRVAKAIDVVDPDDLALVARRLPLARATGARARVPRRRLRHVRGPTRSSRRRAAHPRHVRDARVLQAAGRHRRAVPRTVGCGPVTWPTCSTASSCCAGGSRTSSSSVGRNVFPEDIERAVGTLDGVRAGNVIAFGMEGYKGKESVVVVAEVRRSEDDERSTSTPCATPSTTARSRCAGCRHVT